MCFWHHIALLQLESLEHKQLLKVERDSKIFFRNGSYIGHINSSHPIHHVRHLERKNIFCPPWKSPPPSNMEIFCPTWISPPNIQILKYFAHLDHHLEHLAGYSRSSDLSGAVGNLAKESSNFEVQSQKSKIKDKLFKLSTSIIFPLLTIVIFFACESGAATSAATFGK